MSINFLQSQLSQGKGLVEADEAPPALPTVSDFWAIDDSKILQPGKSIFEFVVNAFFTSYHQIAITGNILGELHPHSYRLQVKAAASMVTRNNQVVVSYESIRSVVEQVARAYEGKTLNDLPPFKNLQPTTENCVGVIFQQLKRLSISKPFRVIEVTLMESPTVGVTYRENERG
jgi:6-pyruvoyltetrahydropterin/6-carboxytetrahydropterin synthase